MTHLCNYGDVKRCLRMHILPLDISHVLLFTFLIAQEILYKLLHFVNCVLVGSFERFAATKGPVLATLYLQGTHTREAVNVDE